MDLVLAPFFEHIAQWWQQINKLLEEKNISMYEEKEREKILLVICFSCKNILMWDQRK